MKLTSPDFLEGARIDSKHASYSSNIPIQLHWSELPSHAKSLALICDDPDALKPAGKIWVHWIVYNIAPQTNGTPFSSEAVHGFNDFGAKKYDGPNPPDAEHRYYFELFALDVPQISLKSPITREKFRKKYREHIIESCILSGLAEPAFLRQGKKRA